MTPNKEALALAERTVKVLCPNMDTANMERLTNELATEITRFMQNVAQEGTWIAQEAADAGMEAVLKMAKKNSGLMQPRAQSGGEVDVMPWVRRTAEERTRHLEMMAAAYIKKTGLPPDECELCEQTEGPATRWWFRPKKETLRAALTGGWRPIDTLPEPMQRPGRFWVMAEGFNEHSGKIWHRLHAELVHTSPNDPFGIMPEDADRIRKFGGMDGIERLTLWMPANLPTPPADGERA